MKHVVFLFLLIVCNASGQIVIVDDGDRSPISDVYISLRNGVISTTSDQNGHVNFDVFSSIYANDTLVFKHLGYEPLAAIKSGLLDIDTIVLYKREYSLAQVYVHSSKQYKFKKISACYRTYQSVNGDLILYSDGTIDYSAKTNKEKYFLNRKNYRVFRNEKYFQDLPDFTAVAEYINTPRLPTHFTPQQYFDGKKHSIVITGDNTADLLKDGVKIGNVKKDSTILTYIFDEIVEPMERHIFKTDFATLSFVVTMVFKFDNLPLDQFLATNLDNLIYFSNRSIVKAKHKKEKNFKTLDTTQEIFIESIVDTDDVEMDEYTFRSGVGEQSQYTYEYWLDCNCEMYYPPTDIPYKLLSEGDNLLSVPE